MNKKEREVYKRNRIREMYVYRHMSLRDIAEELNQDPEFKRRCGSIAVPTVQYWVNKIKVELEGAIDGDGIDRYVADFARKSSAMDQELSDVDKMLKSDSLKQDDKLKLMRFRHEILKDQLSMLQDAELPLTIKKFKKERELYSQRLNLVEDEEDTPKIEFKNIAEEAKQSETKLIEDDLNERKYTKMGTRIYETTPKDKINNGQGTSID